MESLRIRCNLRVLIFSFILIACLIVYKIIVIQRYISKFTEFGNRYMIVDSEHSQFADAQHENLTLDAFTGERIVHLDLKGAPPTLTYFRQLFPLLYALNVTGVLIEYEDVFPYSEKLTHAINTYTKEDIRVLLKLAKKSKIKVIPLVQTFGHLEFLLKVYKFFHLREVHRYPQSICPSHNDTFDVLTGMLDEVIALQPDIQYLHIGCDEVYQLGVCSKCTRKMTQNRWSIKDLFLNHVTRIAKYIRNTYPHITPLIWDDEMRSIPIEILQRHHIGKLVQPVVWAYQPKVSLPLNLWDKYSRIFPEVWVASSFKGATGPDQLLPNISYHMENHKSWLHLMASYSNLITFKGIISTGWQRYDHFAVLCELLPVSIPSLVNNMLLLRGTAAGYMDVSKKVKDAIVCGKSYEYSETCNFPGVNLYNAVVGFSKLREEITKVLESSYIKGWLTAHNLERGYFNPLLVEELSYKINDCQSSLRYTQHLLETELQEIYDSYTVTEWMETYVKPYFIKLDRISGILHYIINITDWSPRPIEMINGPSELQYCDRQSTVYKAILPEVILYWKKLLNDNF